MATNSFKNTQLVVDGTIASLHDASVFIGLIDKQYDDKYAKRGAKIGNSIDIKKPFRPTTTVGDVATEQDYTEEWTTLTVSTQRHAMVAFKITEQTMDLNDFKMNVADPIGLQMSSDMEGDVLESVMPSVGNTIIVSSGNLTQTDVVNAGVKLTQGTTPVAKRCLLVNPVDEGAYVVANTGLFNPSAEISKEFTEASVGRANSFDWFRSNNLPNITLPAAGLTGTMSATYVAGATTMAITGFGATNIIEAGTIIEVTGTNAVQVENKRSLGYKFQISVRETVTLVAGAGTLSVEPMYAVASAGLQNVSVLPTSGAIATIIGEAGATYRQSLTFVKQAFTLATVDLEQLNVKYWARQNMDGISGTFTQDGNISTYKNFSRFDVLYGQRCLRPEYACKIWVKVV
jgi:hypothetical protein